MKFSTHLFIGLLAVVISPPSLPVASAEVGGISGSSSVTLNGTSGAPNYLILTMGSSEESVFTGAVDSVSDSNITFAASTDDENVTTDPFIAGSFFKDAQVPSLTVTRSGTTVGSIAISYGGGFVSYLGGFSNAPNILIDYPDGGGDLATATSTVSSGQITGISITTAGSTYNTTPTAKVIGGAHLARIIDQESSFYGRYFLINDNSATTLNLSFDRVANGETATASTFFSAGTLIEIIPATTIGSFLGTLSTDLPTNWTTASSRSIYNRTNSDWVYYWDIDTGGYSALSFCSGASVTDGWYGSNPIRKNNQVIFPDEAVIVAKRTTGDVTFEASGAVSTESTTILLPEEGNQIVLNNPMGMDLLLAEIIPSTAISPSSNSKFRAGTSNSDTDADFITFLAGSTWKTFWYKAGVNDSVTSLMQAGAKSGSGGSNAITSNDLFIGSGTVTAVETCTNAAGAGATTNGNDGNFTKLTLSGTTPATGFTITLSDVQGYLLSDDGGSELNATTGESVDTNGTGSIVYSNLIGTHEIVGSGSGYVVVEKQRDVNFKSNEGSPSWNVGSSGGGYSQSAKWWAVGGGGSNANGTVTSGGSFTVTSGGSGYSSAPQIVISGGGWRYSDDSSRGGEVLGKNEGVIIVRDANGGVKSFLEPTNPNE